MSETKFMPWIDELPGAAVTHFPTCRDEIAALIAEAAQLMRKAEELRTQAYFTSCNLEGEAKAYWSIEAINQAKRRVS